MKLKYLAPFAAMAALNACAVRVSEVTQVGGQAEWATAPADSAVSPTATFPVTPPPTSTLAPTTGPLSDLGLAGRLLYTQGADGLWQIDFATGQSGQLWQLPERAYLAGVAAAPDGSQLALAYSPPPPEGTPQLGATDIYLAHRDATNPQALIERTVQYESFSNPVWSPDGDWLYYTHSKPVTDESGSITGVSLNAERLPLDGSGEPEIVIENGQQLSISADGSRVAYIAFDFENYTQSLWAANADGSDARELVAETAFFALAGARISPDGETVVFSASGQPTAAADGILAALVNWLRVPVAEAHGPPWELWAVPAAGGELVQLTELFTDSPWPAWSPDGEQIAMLSPGGVVLLQPDGPLFVGPATGHGELIWTP